jgi:hypothetical protein
MGIGSRSVATFLDTEVGGKAISTDVDLMPHRRPPISNDSNCHDSGSSRRTSNNFIAALAEEDYKRVLQRMTKPLMQYFQMFIGDIVLGGDASARRCGLKAQELFLRPRRYQLEQSLVR